MLSITSHRPSIATMGKLVTRIVSVVTFVMDYSRATNLDRFDDQEQVWVGLQNWIYTRQFDMSGHSIDDKSVWLKCDGIDTVANIRYQPTPAIAL